MDQVKIGKFIAQCRNEKKYNTRRTRRKIRCN